jgi:hypothetical protein
MDLLPENEYFEYGDDDVWYELQISAIYDVATRATRLASQAQTPPLRLRLLQWE